MADIVDALNISSSLSIKYGTIKGSGSASYVNENKVNDSDLNFIVSVKVLHFWRASLEGPQADFGLFR